MNAYMECPLHWLVGTDNLYHYFQSRLEDSNERDIAGYTLLHIAAQSPMDNFKTVKLLLDRGADVNSTNSFAQTPLYFAVSSRKYDTVVALIKAGASVNSKDLWGRTPLELAITSRNSDNVFTLIKAGASVNSEDYLGRTPLHFAVYSRNRFASVALIEAGANVNSEDLMGRTALHLSVCTRRCYSLMYDLGKDCDLRIVTMLLRHPEITLNPVDDIGETPLVCAVKEQDFKVVRALLKKCANPNIPDIFGQTALHKALSKQNPSINIVLRLLKCGADIYCKDTTRQTPVDLLLRNALDNHAILFAMRCLRSIALRYRVRECLRHKLEEIPSLYGYFYNCCREVSIMKTLVIYENVTLHDFALGCFQKRVEGPGVVNYLPVVEVLATGLIQEYFKLVFRRLSAAHMLGVLVKAAESSSVLLQISLVPSCEILFYNIYIFYKQNSQLKSRLQGLKHLLTASGHYKEPFTALNETMCSKICNFLYKIVN